ncbi:facilitated trehalose transporter Tret1-like isoform X2 [Achroia grisella]|uniref:facilitated trehalose transporter Tret1-like isoform X2 n=1 Tax=Achroia grisella TaxID=688607 RepID=UPI0027D30D44|nr:facilitated trehalose transporter Tret1-like isoform X2 [Achroia grisella]
MEQGNRKAQYLIAAAVSLTTATMGVSSAWPTPVIPKLLNNETGMVFHDQHISWMVALNTPGFVIGSLATSFISDTYGRRFTLMSSAIPIALGTMLVAFFMEAWLVSVTRLFWGLGTGMISTVVNIYMVEIADKDIRARLTVVTKYMFNFGNCLEGKVDDAKKSLSKLRIYKNEKELNDAVALMERDVNNEMRRSSSFKELIVGKQYRKAVIISIGLRIGMVMTGLITTRNYLGRIMQESKSTMRLDMVFIIFGAVNFLVGVMSSILVDRVGRRPLLVYSFLGTGLSLALTTGYFFCQEILLIKEQYLSPYGVIPFIGIVLSTIISGLGYNSIIFTIGAEIFPMNVKSIAMTSLSVFSGILGFSVAKGYQEVKNVSGLFGVFLIFTIVALGSAIFCYYVVPETKGKSLKEIQMILQGDLYLEDEVLNAVVAENLNEEPGETTELRVLEKKE